MIVDDLQCPKDSWVGAEKRRGPGPTVRYMPGHYGINWKQKRPSEIVWKDNKNWAGLLYI